MQSLNKVRNLTFLIVISLISLFAGERAQAQVGTGVIRVAPNGTDVAGCGSAAQPCRTPKFAVQQSIVNSSIYSGEVRLAAGRYSDSNDSNLIFVGLPANLAIRGGYSTSDWGTSDPATNATILDGQNAKQGIFISVSDAAAGECRVSISNLTIENGRSRAELGNTYGGGILIDNCSDVRVSNVTVRNSKAVGLSNTGNSNAASGAGGAIAVRGNTNVKAGLRLQNVVLSGNQAIGGNESSATRGGLGVGGALFATDSNLTFTNVTVVDNVAQAGNAPTGSGAEGIQRADGLGGGLAIIQAPLFSINGLTVARNKAAGGNASGKAGLALGGGIFIEFSKGSISQATLQSNQTVGGTSSGSGGEGGAGLGGAIFQTDSTLTLDQVSMLDNTATAGAATGANSKGENGGGGGLYATVGSDSNTNSLTASNLIIARNTGTASSGTVSNGGDSAGGIMLNQTNFSLNNITLADNRLAGSYDKLGAAIALIGAKTTGTIQNSIIANHTSAGAIYAIPGIASVSLNTILSDGNSSGLIQSGSASIAQQNILSGDPRFVNAAGSDFHISSGSAAIDRANANAASLDIDGQKRPAGQAADLGADEFEIGLSGIADDTSISLSWQAPAGTTITQYVIEYSKDAGAADARQGASPINAGTQTSFSLTGLTKNKTYSIKIVGYNGNTRIVESSVLSFYTGAVRIALPLVSGSR